MGDCLIIVEHELISVDYNSSQGQGDFDFGHAVVNGVRAHMNAQYIGT